MADVDFDAVGRDAATYLDLLRRALTGALHQEVYAQVPDDSNLLDESTAERLRQAGVELAERTSGTRREQLVDEGRRGWPLVGETMIGMRRLTNLQRCLEQVLRDGVAGDVIEAGIWRGGAVILMRAVLKAYGVNDRLVFAADSFQGLPPPDEQAFPADVGDMHHTFDKLAVDEITVRANFERYGLLDDQVRFLAGWFKDTLPTVADRRWALIRLDGDMYESTMTSLEWLYPRLSPGGYVIVDDFGAIEAAAQAVHDFREEHHVVEPLQRIDWTGVYWRRARSSEEDDGARRSPRGAARSSKTLDGLPPAKIEGKLREHWLERVAFATKDTYLDGVPLKKFPEDLRVYEDLLWRSRADTVIEIGVSGGGSALWFRDRLRTLQHYGRAPRIHVIGIDLQVGTAHGQLQRIDPAYADTITLVEGDVEDPDVAAHVSELVGPEARCLVVEDSAHTYETTFAALRNYADLVPLDGFFVVEDGCVDIEAMRLSEEWPRGVLPAVMDWLATEEGSCFTVRRDMERYGISCHPHGFLHRNRYRSSASLLG